MILIGPAGTGKTTTVMVQEALTDFFYATGSMSKSAPTITAARLSRGNTIHALYKLPLGTLHGRRGKLSAEVLKRFRRSWKDVKAQAVDEISMVMPHNFYQMEVRSRTATAALHEPFGGLGTLLGGDFLQLPPVDGPSLALPWTEIEKVRAQCDGEALSKSRGSKGKGKIAGRKKDAKQDDNANDNTKQEAPGTGVTPMVAWLRK